MTGEMGFIDQDGNDSNGEQWALHAAIAKALGGELKPFDVYQGPYIVIGGDIRVGDSPYALAPTGLGVIRLWICPVGGDSEMFVIYREDTDTTSFEFWYDRPDDIEMAIDAARSLMEVNNGN